MPSKHHSANFLRILVIAMLLALSAFALSPIQRVYAGALAVTITTDELVANGTCSLREAIAEANAAVPGTYPECGAATGGGADVITLPAGTYTLDLPFIPTYDAQLRVTSDITINGAGAGSTIIQASTCDPTAAVSLHT